MQWNVVVIVVWQWWGYGKLTMVLPCYGAAVLWCYRVVIAEHHWCSYGEALVQLRCTTGAVTVQLRERRPQHNISERSLGRSLPRSYHHTDCAPSTLCVYSCVFWVQFKGVTDKTQTKLSPIGSELNELPIVVLGAQSCISRPDASAL
jgi:hypothetical protein